MSRPRVFDYIEAVAQTGSIRKAADALNVASSAVNRMIIDYETELGTPLFERHARGARLTSAGEFVIAHIHETAKNFESFRSRIDGLRGIERGKVTIATVEAASAFLARELGRFHMDRRRISYEMDVLGSASVVAAVEQERVDVGLALNVQLNRQISVVASERYVFHAFMGSDHPLAERPDLRISDCIGFPLALGDRTSGGRTVLDQLFETMDYESPPFLTSNSFSVMMDLVRHTDAICFQFLDERSELSGGGLRAIRIADSRLKPIDLSLVVSARRALPPAAAFFVDRLSKAMDTPTA